MLFEGARCSRPCKFVRPLLLVTALGIPAAPGRADEPSLADELPRIPAVEPDQALSTFKVQRGFALQLVAHEPLVADPVDACFDEEDRLYVAEMHGYPYSAESRTMQPEPLGKKEVCLVRRLEDTDGDGVFDHSTVFADKLDWCLSVCCYDGGVFALAPPYLHYLKDTTGDGVADVREIVLSGFSRYNVQGLANNLKWALDNRLYGSGGTNSDNELVRNGEPIGAMRGRNFALDPKTRSVEFLTGGQQFGHSFDDWGNIFVCSNSNHIEHVVFPIKYLDRTPGVSVSGVIRTIAKEGPAAPVFRTSSAEPWRIVRTRRRAADPDFQKRLPPTELVPIGFFTSATGVTIYRGDAYPEEYRGNAFIGDVGGNLVHRKTLAPDGVSFVAARADENVEFITSTDNWFRPVNFVNGPDGCLYILDMYRETIEHPSSIPEDIKTHLDLYSGDNRGRIYRLVPPGWKSKPVAKLGGLSTTELVAQLDSSNAWNRETAQRLLWERQDQSAAPALRKLLQTAASPTARVHALHTLDGLGAVQEDDIESALGDGDPRVREHGVRVAENHRTTARGIAVSLLGLTGDPDLRVRFQLALSLGEFNDDAALEGLTALARQPQIEPDLQQAMLTSVGKRAPRMAANLIASDIKCTGAVGTLRWLERVSELAAVSSDEGVVEILGTLAALQQEPSDSECVKRFALRGAARGLRTRGRTLSMLLARDGLPGVSRQLLDSEFTTARAIALDPAALATLRTAAIEFLSQDGSDQLTDVAGKLLSPQQPQEIQIAAVRAVANHPGDEAAKGLLAPWPSASPAVRAEIVDALLRSRGRTQLLVAALESGDVKSSEIAPDKRQALLNHPSTAVRDRAAKLLGVTSADRQEVIARYEPALDGDTDADRGKAVFQKTCINCHKVGDAGHLVGPDLASIANKSPRDLLIALLDPSREAQPNYTNYTAVLTDGRIVTGIIAAETSSAVTFRRAEGKEDLVLREQIEELKSNGQSLMPVGLEKDITPEQMADVIAFIKRIAPAGASGR